MSMMATYEREYTKTDCGCPDSRPAKPQARDTAGRQNIAGKQDAAGEQNIAEKQNITGKQDTADGCRPQLAIATVPTQQWEEPYQPSQALICGTIFPSLNKPFYKTGGEFRG